MKIDEGKMAEALGMMKEAMGLGKGDSESIHDKMMLIGTLGAKMLDTELLETAKKSVTKFMVSFAEVDISTQTLKAFFMGNLAVPFLVDGTPQEFTGKVEELSRVFGVAAAAMYADLHNKG